MNTIIAQTQALRSIALPPAPPLVEGGIMAAIAIYIVKEGVSFFKSKDASEEKLTRTLIEDLRSARANELRQQSEVLGQMKQSYDKIATAIEQTSVVTAEINLSLQISSDRDPSRKIPVFLWAAILLGVLI